MKNRAGRVAFGRVTAREAYDETVKRIQNLRDMDFNVLEIWECELNAMLKADPEMSRFFKNCEVRDPLNPRDALAGGRTETNCLHYECKPGEKIDYVDVVR